MNIGLHKFPQRTVDSAVPSQSGQSVKNVGDDLDPEMTATISRARMTDVQMRLIDHIKDAGRQALLQALPNLFDSLERHGSTALNGLTSASSQAPECM